MKDAFIRRARGVEPVTTAHPLLAEVFADTFGIMLYQEDVIRAAMAVAGLDATEGDVLRRDLGKRSRSHAPAARPESTHGSRQARWNGWAHGSVEQSRSSSKPSRLPM